MCGLFERLDGFRHDPHPLFQPRTGNIFLGCTYGPGILVIATDFRYLAGQACLAAGQRLLPDVLPQCVIVLRPAVETKSFPNQPGGHIGNHHRTFNQKRATAAQGINQSATPCCNLRPTRPQQQGSGQIFLQWCRYHGHTVAPLVQTATGHVEADGDSILRQSHIDSQIRVLQIHIRPFTEIILKLVDDRILDLLGTKFGVPDGIVGTNKVNRNGLPGSQVCFPGNRSDATIQIIGTADVKLLQGQEHPIGQARPQTGPVGKSQCALHIDTRHCLPGFSRTQ